MSTRGGLQIEYAVSSRACCKACGGVINQDTIRVGKETRSDHHDGWDLSWYHLKCCNKSYGAPSFSKIAELKHWERLRWDDQTSIRKQTSEPLSGSADDKALEQHNRALWDMKDTLNSNLNNKQIKELFAANVDVVPDKIQAPVIIHFVADGMLWGRIGACPTCKSYRLYYDGVNYKCKGWLSSGFTRCDFVGKDGIVRYKYTIPEALKKVAYLKNFKYPAGHPKLAFGSAPAASSAETTTSTEAEAAPEEDDNTPEDEVPVGKELHGISIITAGTKKDLGMTAAEIANLVTEHGGDNADSVDSATVMISAEAELTKRSKSKKVKDALGTIPILSMEFLTNLCERKEEGIALRKNEEAKKYLIEPSTMSDTPIATKYRINAKPAASSTTTTTTTTSSSVPAGEGGEKRKRVVRRHPKVGSDILKIDPASGRGSSANIIVTDDPELGATTYNVMLNQTDIQTGQNKFYRLQAYQYGKKYYGFINYGRIGTDTGNHIEYPKNTQKSAIDFFIEKYEEKTGNKWANRDAFEKKGGKYYMVDLDDGWGDEDEEVKQTIKRQRVAKESAASQSSSSLSSSLDSGVVPAKKRLAEPVANLIRLLFDKEMMKKQMVALDIDIKKMPLGKISKKQILLGYQVLTEIQDLLQESATPSPAKLADCANRLYTLIPHDFGHNMPPVIDNLEAVKKKMNMLDTLIDLEIAANLMKEAEVEDSSEYEKLEANYKVLKTGLEPMDKSSELYKLLESYAYNTQDKTVYQPTFQVEDIFYVSRESEESRYEPWKEDKNRVLLWHGSRLTNWVGILSQGLRIAPPEAPKTGYRFGKGVYFADCVSKSTSYCFSSRDSPTAVLLLGEVALGNMNQLKHDQYMEKAPSGTHSTKALGMAAPNPALDQAIHSKDEIAPIAKVKDLAAAIKVPCGKIAPTGLKTSCTHNEYIVYDVSQIKIKYLLRVRINHK